VTSGTPSTGDHTVINIQQSPQHDFRMSETASNTADEVISYRVDQSLTTNQSQAGANPRAAATRPLSLPGADDKPRVHQIKRLTRRVIDGQIVLQHLPVRPLNDYQVAGV
jgi:hypothetical protein